MVTIKHLSATVNRPEQTATALALMTNGSAQPFQAKNLEGAWVCVWNAQKNELIEFLPPGYVMQLTESGFSFQKIEGLSVPNSVHIQLETALPLRHIQKIADQFSCPHHFRPQSGGPLYEVWLESQFLVEFVSPEIRQLLFKNPSHLNL